MFILFLALLLRLLPSLDGQFPFMYDHAKDSLALLQMSLTRTPVMYVAVTSIPGVFNGPFPYYVFLPGFMGSGFEPYANVLTVIFCSLLVTVFLWRKNRLAAVLWACSSAAIGSQTSAWYPYLTPFFTLPIGWILWRTCQTKKMSTLSVIILGICTGLLFHAQTAFGMVFVPAILVSLFLIRPQTPRTLQTRQIRQTRMFLGLLGVLSFGLCFTPFLIFELRHQFHQTQAILEFLSQFGTQAAAVSGNTQGFSRVLEVLRYSLEAGGLALSPLTVPTPVLYVLSLLPLGANLWKRRSETLRVWLPLLLIPTALYLFLPVKPYYFVGLLPIWILLFSRATQLLPKMGKQIFVAIWILGTGWQLGQTLSLSTSQMWTTSNTYAIKELAVLRTRSLAAGRPFRVYHLVPEVYDYVYQFLWLRQRTQGLPLPTEFSYKPGATGYVVEKESILRRLAGLPLIEAHSTATESAVFVVVEKNGSLQPVQVLEQVFPSVKVLQTATISGSIAVFEVKPENF